MMETKELDALYRGRVFEASINLNLAIQCLKNSVVWICTAAGEVENYPAENRILSLMDGINDMITAITAERARLEEGEKEHEKQILL